MRLRFKPEGLRLALAASALTVFPGTAHAGAWLQPKGKGLLILSGTMLSSGSAFDDGGGSFDVPRYNKFELDGWLALRSQLPPKEKRGLVLVDPPFEEDGEFERLVDGLAEAHRRFSSGIYALWYPLKDQKERDAFVAALRETGIAKMLRAEVMVRAPAHPPRLFGTGMMIVNPPYTLEGELKVLLPPLATILADNGRGTTRIEWIRGE